MNSPASQSSNSGCVGRVPRVPRSLGVAINVSHLAATLPGQTVTVTAECIEVKGRRLTFKVSAHDGIDLIGDGTHARAVVPWVRFRAMVNGKAAKAGVAGLV